MTAVILTIHTLLVLGLIGVVLLQRSEGGALGMGAGTGGGFMSGRAAANALTRTTSLLAAAFFATSLGLAIMSDTGSTEDSTIEELTGEPVIDPADVETLPETTADDILNTLGGSSSGTDSTGSDAAPLTEAEILDALGSDAPAADTVPGDTPADPETTSEPTQSDENPQ